MDRLTFTQEDRKRDGLGSLKYLSPEMCAEYDKRLAAYEDTKMTPAEIVAMKARVEVLEHLLAKKPEEPRQAACNELKMRYNGYANHPVDTTAMVAPSCEIPITENRVLTLDEVLALPDGARVWVEDSDDSLLGGEHFKFMLSNGESVLRRVDQPHINARFLHKPYFGTYYRVWLLPRKLTPEEELTKWPWEERESNV